MKGKPNSALHDASIWILLSVSQCCGFMCRLQFLKSKLDVLLAAKLYSSLWRRQLIFIKLNEYGCLSSSAQWMTWHVICAVFQKKEYFWLISFSFQCFKLIRRNLSKVVLCKYSLYLDFSRSCSYRKENAVLKFSIKKFIGKYTNGMQKSVNGCQENRSGKN